MKLIERQDLWALFASAAAVPVPAIAGETSVAATAIAPKPLSEAIAPVASTAIAPPTAPLAMASAATTQPVSEAISRHLNNYFDYVLVDAECTHDGSYR